MKRNNVDKGKEGNKGMTRCTSKEIKRKRMRG